MSVMPHRPEDGRPAAAADDRPVAAPIKPSAAPSGAPDLAIEVRGLRKVYGGSRRQPPKEALKGIDLEVPRGSIFGLLGPNGAGKSTLINILAGLVVKTSGTARVWGLDIDLAPRRARRAIGVVPQELNIDPFMKASSDVLTW